MTPQERKGEDKEMNRNVRREMGRHSVDTSEVQVNYVHGSVTLMGRVRPMRGHEEAFEEALSSMLKALRQRSGIRDVRTEWTKIS